MNQYSKALMLIVVIFLLVFSGCVKAPSGPDEQATAPTTSASEEFNSPSPTDFAITDDPTQAPVSPSPAAESSPAPRLDCPDKDGLDEHDYYALRAYLERGSSGVKNGVLLNESYDPEDPATWYYFYDIPGRLHPIAWWDADGCLAAYYGCSELTGDIDLSGCVHLNEVFINDNGSCKLNLEGCPLKKSVYIYNSILYGKDEFITSMLRLEKCHMKHIHWLAVPDEEENWNSFCFELTLDADGEGFVGIRKGDTTHYIELFIVAEPQEGSSFIGWYDSEGNLISNDPVFEMTSLISDHTAVITGSFAFTARFE